MKNIFLLLIFISTLSFADTPPPGTVKAKMFSGDGVTALTTTGSALNVNITSSSGASTVNQGNAGSQSWLAAITSSVLPTNACQETGGHLASIDSKLTSPISVAGTFFQATQPVSAVSLPLPSGAATSALQTTGNTSLSNIDTKIPALGQALAASSVPIVLTASQLSTLTPLTSVTVTQATGANLHTTIDNSSIAVTAASLPLPSGASTSVKQPALGTAGSASTDVITVQGIASMTALKVDGSAVTQPISGTVTADTSPVAGVTPSQTTGTVSTVITLTAPANAQGFILQNLQTSLANIRFALGATATTSVGMQLAPGQDSGFVPVNANVSIVAESGTLNYNIQWVAK